MPAEKPAPETSSLERIAKVMARAGIASRRDAEKTDRRGPRGGERCCDQKPRA